MNNFFGPEHTFANITEPGVYVLIKEGKGGHIVMGEIFAPKVGPAIRQKVICPQTYRVGSQVEVGVGVRPLIFKIGVRE